MYIIYTALLILVDGSKKNACHHTLAEFLKVGFSIGRYQQMVDISSLIDRKACIPHAFRSLNRSIEGWIKERDQGEQDGMSIQFFPVDGIGG
jgi:hypothetical protein